MAWIHPDTGYRITVVGLDRGRGIEQYVRLHHPRGTIAAEGRSVEQLLAELDRYGLALADFVEEPPAPGRGADAGRG